MDSLPGPALRCIINKTQAYDWPFLRLVGFPESTNYLMCEERPLTCYNSWMVTDCCMQRVCIRTHVGRLDECVAVIQVCKSWREAVDLEIRKICPQQLPPQDFAVRFPGITSLSIDELGWEALQRHGMLPLLEELSVHGLRACTSQPLEEGIYVRLSALHRGYMTSL